MAAILVLDAEPVVRRVVTNILERKGHSVQSTGEFQQALAILRDSRPDLVLTNVYLSNISGHDAMTQIRAEFPDVPVLMVSGLPDHEVITDWVGKIGFDVFPKPFTRDALADKVEQMLNGSADGVSRGSP